jgi:hypothetical protein
MTHWTLPVGVVLNLLSVYTVKSNVEVVRSRSERVIAIMFVLLLSHAACVAHLGC